MSPPGGRRCSHTAPGSTGSAWSRPGRRAQIHIEDLEIWEFGISRFAFSRGEFPPDQGRSPNSSSRDSYKVNFLLRTCIGSTANAHDFKARALEVRAVNPRSVARLHLETPSKGASRLHCPDPVVQMFLWGNQPHGRFPYRELGFLGFNSRLHRDSKHLWGADAAQFVGIAPLKEVVFALGSKPRTLDLRAGNCGTVVYPCVFLTDEHSLKIHVFCLRVYVCVYIYIIDI